MEVLKRLLSAGPAPATLTITMGEDQPAAGKGHSFNLYGEVPGTTDETLVIMSHHDGGATNEASGASCVMALADYYGLHRKGRGGAGSRADHPLSRVVRPGFSRVGSTEA